MEYLIAEKNFKENNFDLAFSQFKEIAEDKSQGSIARADSFTMMGVIVNAFSPYLYPEDESGLIFFKYAIQLDPNNIGALLNVVENFGGDLPSDHHDELLFKYACIQLLNEVSDKIDEKTLIRVKSKCSQYQ